MAETLGPDGTFARAISLDKRNPHGHDPHMTQWYHAKGKRIHARIPGRPDFACGVAMPVFLLRADETHYPRCANCERAIAKKEAPRG